MTMIQDVVASFVMPTCLIEVEDPDLGYDAETFPHPQSLGFSITTTS